MVILYGINNCDTIKKAKHWLDHAGIEYRFHDYRKDGLDAETLTGWTNELGWEALLNRRGTTWRKLPDAQKSAIDHHSAIQLMLEQPAMIKRPLLEYNHQKILGFSEQSYNEIFNH